MRRKQKCIVRFWLGRPFLYVVAWRRGNSESVSHPRNDWRWTVFVNDLKRKRQTEGSRTNTYWERTKELSRFWKDSCRKWTERGIISILRSNILFIFIVYPEYFLETFYKRQLKSIIWWPYYWSFYWQYFLYESIFSNLSVNWKLDNKLINYKLITISQFLNCK